MVVISPHLDDAVFGCAEAIASEPGSTVVTVFAGYPGDGDQLTEWDARCGFASAKQAVDERRAEDRRGLDLLAAKPRWLDFGDSQYGISASCGAIAAALDLVLDELQPSTVLYPLGLFHSDHHLVHDACIEALADSAFVAYAYEDALYRTMPGLLQRRLCSLASAGFVATPTCVGTQPGSGERKARAVQAYASQLRAFGPDGYADTHAPERCWHLERTDKAEASRAAGSPHDR